MDLNLFPTTLSRLKHVDMMVINNWFLKKIYGDCRRSEREDCGSACVRS